MQVRPRLRVLPGIDRADRWPELRPSAVDVVLDLARDLSAVTVVDCGFSLERDEELSFDTAAPRPYSQPSRISPLYGEPVQPSPGGTTSPCAFKAIVRPSP